MHRGSAKNDQESTVFFSLSAFTFTEIDSERQHGRYRVTVGVVATMSGRSGGSAATSNRISQSQLASSQRTDEDITAPAHLQVSHSEEVSLVGSGDAHAVQGTVPDAGEQGSDDELLVSENERDDVVHAPDERHTPPSSDREVPSVESARGERAVHESSEPNSGREPDPEGPLEGSARAADEERKPPSSEREAPSVESARGGGDADESNRASAQVHAELDESLARRTKEHPAREVTPDAARHPMREPAGNERTTWLPTQNQTNEDFRPSGVEMASARLTETPLYVIKDEEYRQVCPATPCNTDMRADTSANPVTERCLNGYRDPERFPSCRVPHRLKRIPHSCSLARPIVQQERSALIEYYTRSDAFRPTFPTHLLASCRRRPRPSRPRSAG